jgi:hypothetical protein
LGVDVLHPLKEEKAQEGVARKESEEQGKDDIAPGEN